MAALLLLPEWPTPPLTWLPAQARWGGGKINVTQFQAASPAFFADARGEIPIAAFLADSPLQDLPVHFSLSQSLARKLNWAPADAPPDAFYVPLPDFIKITGTI